MPTASDEVKEKIRDYKASLAITTYPTNKYDNIFEELKKINIMYTL